MDLGLTGRRALVTGASRGIGRSIAAALAREGCDVTLVARNADALAETAAQLAAETGRRITWHATDLTESGAADAALTAHMAAHDGMEILVNNAGASAAGDFFALEDAQWEESFALKFHGAVRMCRVALPALAASGHGVILNNIGAAAKQPKPGFLIGATINAALQSFTKGLAQIGLEQGVRVVSMNSGPVRTEKMQANLERLAAEADRDIEDIAAERARGIFGMWRYADPADLGDLAAFLASDRAQHIHGANIFIDGGQTKEM
ncbi:MAG: SDR family NAD(P)-dependent oxidoreductase [Pseudomonadota bacterium]